jgi:serine/threonine protein kinase
MCTGRPPFRAETSYGILRRITDTEPRSIREINPAIPAWLVAIIAKLHAKDPADRFASADELANLLEQCLAHVQQPTAVPLPDAIAATEPSSVGLGDDRHALRAIHRRSSLVIGSIVAGLLIVIAVLGIVVRNRPDAGQEHRMPATDSAVSTNPSSSENEAETQTTLSAWQDGMVEQIHDLREATDQLETSARRLWEDDASFAASNQPAHAIQPSPQEVTK